MELLAGMMIRCLVLAFTGDADPELSERVSQLERSVSELMNARTFMWIMTGLNVAGVFGIWITLFSFVRKTIKKQIKNLWRVKYEAIKSMVDNAEQEQILKEDQEYVVLRFQRKKTVYEHLKENGFKKVHDRPWDTDLEKMKKQYSKSYLLVLDQPNVKAVNLLLDEMPDHNLIIFYPGRLNVKDPKRVHFANTLATLVPRTLEAAAKLNK